MLVFEERGNPEYPEKNLSERLEWRDPNTRKNNNKSINQLIKKVSEEGRKLASMRGFKYCRDSRQRSETGMGGGSKAFFLPAPVISHHS